MEAMSAELAEAQRQLQAALNGLVQRAQANQSQNTVHQSRSSTSLIVGGVASWATTGVTVQ